MAANLEINSSQFEAEVINSELPVLIDFWAPWCGPCRAIAPSVEALAEEFAGKAKVFKIDVDKEPDLASKYGVMSIPALHVFKGGREVNKAVGALPKDQIKALIESAL
jgi:thioredoxin 1